MNDGRAIHGHCDARFHAVRDRFEAGFRRGAEVGAAAALCVEGRLVVDLWGGHSDQDGICHWEPDTLVNVYSTTKGMTALGH